MRIALMFFLALPVMAAEAPVTDPGQVRAHYQAVLEQPQYQVAEDSFGVRDWLSQWFTHLGAEFSRFKYEQEIPQLASLTMAVFVVLAMAGLLYVFYRATRRRRAWSEPEIPATAGAPVLRAPEFYEEELRRALARDDWREAWLASWRQFLSRLERERLVETDRSRTNREYLAQLQARALPVAAMGLVTQAVDLYDRFIYGKRPVTEPDWQSFRRQVDEATLLLHLQEGAA